LRGIGDCNSARNPRGVAYNSIARFARSESDWITAYTHAWWTATEVGLLNLHSPVSFDVPSLNVDRANLNDGGRLNREETDFAFNLSVSKLTLASILALFTLYQ